MDHHGRPLAAFATERPTGMTKISTDGRIALTCSVNGAPVDTELSTSRVLADFLRDNLGLKGTKVSCGRGVCGACTVTLDGVPRAACQAFAFEAEGAQVRTVEGLAGAEGELHALQAAFQARSAFQCGFCTSGMLMLLSAKLAEKPRPTRAEIVHWVSANICRCTGYALIVEAVEEAARTLATEKAAE